MYRHGHSSNLSKLRISMLTADQEAYTGPVEMIDWVWLPGPQLEPDPVRRAKALQFYNGPASTSDAVYLGHQFGGGRFGHVRRQTAIAARAVRAIEQNVAVRKYLTFEQTMYVWTSHARPKAELWASVGPRLKAEMNRKLESLQRRALTTMLGRAAAPGARVNGRALEVVFGELSMKDRR